MSYPKNIIKMRPNKGIVNDIPASEIGPDFYSSGKNIHFRDSFPQRAFGEQVVYDAVDDLRNLINAPDFGPNY